VSSATAVSASPTQQKSAAAAPASPAPAAEQSPAEPAPSAPSPAEPAPPTTAAGAAEAAPEATAPAAAAPDVTVPDELQFTSTTLDGSPFDGASLAGSPAVLWFWAPWCPNCRAEAPQVAAAAAATAGAVTFIGVAAQDELGPMQAFVDNYGVGGFEHLADLDAAIWQRFGVTYQPAYAFISADGSVDVVKSRMSESELADKLADLTAS
jgi:thiol-disulfide isomerase/thioredoxin